MRVAFTVTALAVTVLLAIGYQHVATMSDGFSRVAEDQGLTLTSQLANATAGAGSNVVSVIPYSEQGLDGLAIFDARGHLLASGGGLGPQLRLLGDEARRVAHARRPLQQFRLGHSQVGDTLHPWSSPDTLQVTFIPQDGGTL
ncbi:MAG: hypothetical protein QOJ07_3964, partial [Thermoleophilaceae bacterium]|nr:hypothetical protein [Thermoleophilaceae bacterium]